jgi:hypothetical protein
MKAHISDELKIEVRDGMILVRSASHPRAGLAEEGSLARSRGDDKRLDAPSSMRFRRSQVEVVAQA